MSWSISKMGLSKPVLAAIKKERATTEMSEPEQLVRDLVVGAIKLALRDMPDDMPVEISASGSQSDVGDGTSVNSFTVTVTPMWGFLCK